MTVQFGILLAIICAVLSNVAFLCKHRGACAAPDVNWRHPLRSAKGLFQSKWFLIGFAIAFCAWLFHVAAMAFAPLSLVQSVLSAGLVFLTVIAERLFGFKSLTVSTAGADSQPGAAASHQVTLVGLENADELRELILKMLHHERDAGLGEPSSPPGELPVQRLAEIREAALALRQAAQRMS